MEKLRKIILVGLDGGTFRIIEPGVSSGHLPTLRKIIKEGVSGTLTSTIPPSTIPAFPTILTGKNPGKHGIFSVVGRLKRRKSDQKSKTMGKTLWRVLSDHSRKCIVVNIPLTYPPEPIDGVIISGMTTPPGGHFSHPRELAQTLDELTDGYPVWFDHSFIYGKQAKFVEELHLMIEKRRKAIHYLMDNFDWNLFAVLFRATDIISHHLWNNRQEVLRVYEHCDRVIGEMISKHPDAYVFIFSDHGFGSYTKSFNLNILLKSMGLLKTKSTRKGGGYHKALHGRARKKRLPNLLLKMGLYRSRIRNILPLPVLNLLRKVTGTPLSRYLPVTHLEIDLEQSKAYFQRMMLESSSISLNTSSQEEYDKLLKLLKSRIGAIVDPETGKKVVKDVFHRHEIYSGPFVELAPDIMLLLNEGYKASPTLSGSQIIERLVKSKGTHNRHGIFLARGAHVIRGGKISGISLKDLAPTILHLMDVPIPEDFEGKVKREIYSVKSPPAKRKPEFYIPKPETETKPQLTSEEEDEIAERLRGLGYID